MNNKDIQVLVRLPDGRLLQIDTDCESKAAQWLWDTVKARTRNTSNPMDCIREVMLFMDPPGRNE